MVRCWRAFLLRGMRLCREPDCDAVGQNVVASFVKVWPASATERITVSCETSRGLQSKPLARSGNPLSGCACPEGEHPQVASRKPWSDTACTSLAHTDETVGAGDG